MVDEERFSSQSPSLRGSGRFESDRDRAQARAASLNPLHCGAVVASAALNRPATPPAERLNPLHCGAVVASDRAQARAAKEVESQSPSLRGSGRFRSILSRWTRESVSLNPLHCGAVVASRPARSARSKQGGSLNPLHCGAVVASSGAPCARLGGPGSRLNPLHCGAVVASTRRCGARRSATSLNPLHCGAVVASIFHPRVGGGQRRVSIPFIAGQWSLRSPRIKEVRSVRVSIPFIAGQWSLLSRASATPCRTKFQSPSLRGSGRFYGTPVLMTGPHSRVSIPFIAGQWSLLWDSSLNDWSTFTCFNPLHCGAVVASARRKAGGQGERKFQSPSLRGSGRFVTERLPPRRGGEFQSPSLRGSGRFSRTQTHHGFDSSSFNPLHCGAVVASHGLRPVRGRPRAVSIPFIAGQWSLPIPPHGGGARREKFQSPSLRGSGRFFDQETRSGA